MPDDALAFTPISRQAELIRAGEVGPRELVELYLERIERLNPALNAFRAVYRDRALAEADQAAARLKAGDDRPLLGVPVAIKDNLDVAGDVTTHGTNAYGEPAREDAEVVRRVRAAGAVVLGRTMVPPLCALPVTESPTFGVTRNPWDLDRSPGGSSGGSAAAVAAGLVGAALGSDGGGSIRMPAAWCGLFGLKPQRGRVSTAPHRDHWHGMSSIGWITRSVADTALLLDLTSGPAEGDADRPAPPERPFAESAAQEPGKLRIAYSFAIPPGVVARPTDEVRRGVLDTVELLRSLGHEVSEQDPGYGPEGWAASVRVLRGIADEARSLPRYDRLDRRWRRVTALGSAIPDSLLERARAAEEPARARVARLFARCDVLITPTAPDTPVPIGRWEGRGALWTINGAGRLIPYTAPWNFTGQPAAAVPAGLTDGGLPLSVQLISRPSDEGTILSLAAQLESERPWADRRPPVG
ncbi:MAG: amidase [Solirubrobacteraceae bacterium]|jgi:amidase|nr:amidase [Solirubrobacteraceae bacterium]